MHRLAPFLAVVLAACGGANDNAVREAPTPERAVKQFYDWRISARRTGAPDDEQLEQMKPYLSSELHQLLAQRNGARGDQQKTNEDGRATDGGDLFSSLYEGPTSFTTGEVESDGAAHIVPVRFVYAAQLPAVNWIDRVRVVQENGAYVIADVEYGNHWRYGAGETLVGSLKQNPAKRNKRRA